MPTAEETSEPHINYFAPLSMHTTTVHSVNVSETYHLLCFGQINQTITICVKLLEESQGSEPLGCHRRYCRIFTDIPISRARCCGHIRLKSAHLN